METITSPNVALKLCDCVLNVLEGKELTKDELSSCIKGLKYICCGKPGESICLSSLSNEEKLTSILQIDDFDAFFRLCQNDCIDAADTLLSGSRLTFEICESLKILFSSASKFNKGTEMQLIINKLFNHNDFASVPVELVEEVIRLDTTQLELQIIRLYSEQSNSKSKLDLWNTEESCKRWVSWCSISAKLFSKISSIMNQLLLTVKNTGAILKVISNFIDNVLIICDINDIDFIRLYPIKLQSLVSLMSLNIEGLPLEYCCNLSTRIFDDINVLRKDHPFEALILCTHFNKWEKFLN